MMHGKAILTATLVLFGAWACSGDTLETNPAPTEPDSGAAAGSGGSASGGSSGSGGSTGGSGGSAGSAGTGASAGSAGSAGSGPVVRTVIVRDVFERFDDPNNLMLDGGFELSGEMGNTWGINSLGPMKYGNGAVCHNGVRCGIAAMNKGIYGFFVSPRTGSLSLSLRAMPDGTTCSSLAVYVFDAYSQSAYPQQVSISSASVGADGWCEIEGGFNAMPFSVPLLYLEPSQGKMTIDDVVVTTSVSTFALQAPAKQVPEAMRTHLQQASKRALKLLQGSPGTRRSLRAGAPWTAEVDPWVR